MKIDIKCTNKLFWTKALLLLAVSFPAYATPPSGQNWVLVADDEFANDTTINTNLWGYGSTPWGTEAQGTCCLIRPQDTYLTTNGIVNVTKSGPFTGANGTYAYADGWIWLKPSQWRTYGYLEIKAKYPNEQGAWPAFWMLQSGWPPEIDIAEYRGAPKNYMTEAFYNNNQVWSTTTIPDTGDSFTGWHTYGLEWGPGYLKWYIDGVLKKSDTDPLVPSTPMYAILSGGADCSDANGTGFPNYFVINYFRWYQASTNVPPGGIPVIESANGSNSRVALSWAGVQGATGYMISRASVSGGPYTPIGTTSGINATTFTDTNVVDFNQYYYVVSAVNSAGEGANSSEVGAMPIPPPLSQNKSAAASTYQSGHDPIYGNDGDFSTRWCASSGSFPQWWQVDLGSVQSINKSVITWEFPTSSYKYLIQVSDDDTNFTTVVNNTNNTTAGNSTDTFSASARYVRVTITGCSSGWASFYEFQLFGPPPAAPTALTATGSNGVVSLSWQQAVDPSVVANRVYRSPLSSGPFNPVATLPATTSYADDTVTNGILYYYTVSALNASGESTPSGVASARPISTIPPQAVIADNADGLELSWPVANTGWRLQVQTNELGAGLGTNWTDVLNSTVTNGMIIPVNPGNGSVFYRLVYP